MEAQVLVHPQGVERGGVKAGEEHVHDDDQVYLAGLEALREVLVVVVEAVLAAARGREARVEHLVVVRDGVFQKVAVGRVEALHVKVLLGQAASRVVLVHPEAVDEPHLELLVRPLRLQAFERRVVRLGHVDGGRGEQRVEPHDAPVLEGVTGLALGLLVEVVKDVAHDLVDPALVRVRALAVDVVDLLVGELVLLLNRLDVVDAEGEHVAVADGIHDGVGVKSVTEGLLGRAKVRVAPGQRVLREDGCAGEAEQVVVSEVPSDGSVHLAELAAMALVEDDDHVPVVDGVVWVPLDEDAELLNGRHEDGLLVVREVARELGGVLRAVDGALLELVVLAHGLVVQVLAVDHEHDLVDALHARG